MNKNNHGVCTLAAHCGCKGPANQCTWSPETDCKHYKVLRAHEPAEHNTKDHDDMKAVLSRLIARVDRLDKRVESELSDLKENMEWSNYMDAIAEKSRALNQDCGARTRREESRMTDAENMGR